MGACLQTGCMLILLQHIACSWWILTSRTFPQLQSLHCPPPPSSQVPQITIHKRVGEPLHWALPPLLPVQSSLVPNKNWQIRKRDSERSSIVFSSAYLYNLFIVLFQPFLRAKVRWSTLDQAWSLSTYCLQLMGSHLQTFLSAPFHCAQALNVC